VRNQQNYTHRNNEPLNSPQVKPPAKTKLALPAEQSEKCEISWFTLLTKNMGFEIRVSDVNIR
jgi:hypothetical protein